MTNIQKLMVPVDFSEASQEAVRYGVSLAVELDATLLLSHVVPFLAPVAYAYPFQTSEGKETLVEEIQRKMEDMVAPEYRKTVHCRFVVTSGDVKDELLATVADERPDMIVMGTHGRRLFERWLLGSVAEHVLRHSPVPVMTVSHLDEDHDISEPQPLPLDKIVYATDLSDGSGEALEAAYQMAHKYSAELLVLHVMKPLDWAYGAESVTLDVEAVGRNIRDSLIGQLEASVPERIHSDPRVRTELVEGIPYEEILAKADEEKADLIVLNTQSKSGIERALVGATAERIVRGAHVPVLSVPPPGTEITIPVRTEARMDGGVLI